MFKTVSAILLCAAALPLPALAQSATDPGAMFARAHQLVDIGGRRLNLYCSGSGRVTVVFDSPSGTPGWTWHAVQPAVAKHTRACVYDRAGLGFSDPTPLPGTSANAVSDLHALLKAASIAPPYILVGNSFGGANAQLYAYRYPDQVAGLVLVEAPLGTDEERLNRVTKGKLSQMRAMEAELLKECTAQAERGFVPGSAAAAQCVGPVPLELGRALAAASHAHYTSPVIARARANEEDHFATSDEQLRTARKPFGALPMIVLTRGVSPYAVPNQPQSPLNKAMEAENVAIQKDLAALSTRSVQRIVPGAGHIIQYSHPQAVSQAVIELLGQIR